MDPGQGQLERHADEFTFVWPQYGIKVRVDQVREHTEGMTAEVTIETTIDGVIHWGRLNLASTSARDAVVRHVREARADVHWRRILDRVCLTLTTEVMKGDPIEILSGTNADPLTYLLDDVLEGRINPGRVFDFATDLNGIVEAFTVMNERRAVKSLLRIGTI